MTADWTNRSAETDSLLASLNQKTVPALAIYSPSDPKNPIVLSRDPSESRVLAAIDVCLGKKSGTMH